MVNFYFHGFQSFRPNWKDNSLQRINRNSDFPILLKCASATDQSTGPTKPLPKSGLGSHGRSRTSMCFAAPVHPDHWGEMGGLKALLLIWRFVANGLT